MLNLYKYFDDAEDLDKFADDENQLIEYLIDKTNMYKDKTFRFKPCTLKLLGNNPNTAVMYSIFITNERTPEAEKGIKKSEMAWKSYVSHFPDAK